MAFMDVARVLRRIGGVASTKDLAGLVGVDAVQAALADGVVTRLRRGVVALPSAEGARLEAARRGGVVSHTSAALLHGWKVKLPPREPTITVARSRSRVDAAGVKVYYADLTGQTGVTDPVRTVVDCARALAYDAALAVADSALRSRKVTRQQLVDAVDASPRTGRSRAARVVQAASDKAANPFESVLRAIAHGVTGLTVVPQGEIEEWTHPDLVDFQLRLAIEADSFEYHSLREAFAYDVRRYTALTRDRWVVLRFTWEEVMHKQGYVLAVLTDVVQWRTAELPTLRQAVRGAGA